MQCTKRRAQLRQMFRRFSRTVRLCASGAKCRRHGLARTSFDKAAIKSLARRAGWPVGGSCCGLCARRRPLKAATLSAVMQIRSYSTDDRTTCLSIFRTNVPTYFAASDEVEFARFLDDLPAEFWVVHMDGQIRACGGIAMYYPEPDIATLCWGMVALNFQRQGVGKALLEFRVGLVATQHPTITRLRVNTTQVVKVFYERHSFAAVRVEPGRYGPGLDHVVMDRAVRQLRI